VTVQEFMDSKDRWMIICVPWQQEPVMFNMDKPLEDQFSGKDLEFIKAEIA
jgi:hypothetical protein